MMIKSQAPISVVVIGINTAETIGACLQSIQESDYPEELLEVIYVDGGSADESVEIAQKFPDVKIVELVQEIPTPGRGRNAGWKIAKHSLIQFVDGDSTLDKDWFSRSQEYLKEDVVAVVGEHKELHPRKNWYHLITDIEWRVPPGECIAFGGNVLIRKEVLEQTGGFDEALTAGEDPDLSYRVRKAGWKIMSLSIPMCLHDIRTDSFFTYLKRSARTGWAYAVLAWRYRREKNKFRMKECVRVILSVIIPWGIFKGGMLLGYPIAGAVIGLALALRSFRKIFYFQKKFDLSLTEAAKYALHLSVVVYPQFVGVLKFIFQKVWKNAA